MASITRYKTGWRAQVQRGTVRKSKTFATRQEAKDWAAREEHLAINGKAVARGETLAKLFDRYAREVSPAKRGHRWEVIRLDLLARDPIAQIRLGDLTRQDLAAWRDRRLRAVAPGTVRRERVLLSAVLSHAAKVWQLIDDNPMRYVKAPAEPPPRDRLPTADELERLAHAAGSDLSTHTGRAWHAFRFAMETAMRAGEIVGLTWARVDLQKRVAHLPMTKNGKPRDVPLSSAAVALLQDLPRMDPVFGLTSRQLDALWRRLRDRAAVNGLRFHDSRAAATTMLARKVDVLDLARITGHTDLRQLISTYYRESAADIAGRLG